MSKLSTFKYSKILLTVLLVILVISDTGFSQFWNKKPATITTVDAFEAAVSLYNKGNYQRALEILSADSGFTMTERSTEYQFLLMKCYKETADFISARDIGRLFLQRYPLSRYTSEVFLIFGDMFIDEGKKSSAFRMYTDARRIESNPNSLNRINMRLINTIQLSIPLEILDELLALEFDPNIRNIFNLAKAYTYLYMGDPDNCSIVLSNVSHPSIEDNFLPVYEKLFLASYNPPAKTYTIGVVVPLSGPDSNEGKAFLAGLNDHSAKPSNSGSIISYIIRDNQGDDVETIRQINFLKKNPDIQLIVGPLKDKNVMAAVATMQGEETPLLIPVSKNNNIVTVSPNILQLNAPYSEQGKLAARYAARLSSLPEIGILAPADNFGQEIVDAFIKELDQLDLQPAVVEWYYSLPEDLNRQFYSMRNAAWSLIPEEKNDQYLGLEIDSLDALFDISADDFFDLPSEEKVSMSHTDSIKTVLETLDAVFIPVHPEHLKYLATQFPMYNLKSKVIGSSGWLNLDVLNEENVSPHFQGLTILTTQFEIDMLDSFPALTKTEDPDVEHIYTTGIDVGILMTDVFSKWDQDNIPLKNIFKEINTLRGVSRYIDFRGRTNQVNNGVQVIEYGNQELNPIGFFSADSFNLVIADNP